MTDRRHFTDVYWERQQRVAAAARDRLTNEAFNYRVLNDVTIFPRGRIIGEDYGSGRYYGDQPQWLRIYEERRRRAEDATWGGYAAGRVDYRGRQGLYGDPWSRPYMGPGAYDPGSVASSYNYERAQRHRERLAMTPFATHVHRVNGQIWETTQMRNGDVYRVARPLPTSPEPSTPLGNQKIQIADDPKEPNYRRIEGNLHDIRFVDGYTLDSRKLAGRLTTSVSFGAGEMYRCKQTSDGKVSEVSWIQDGQRYSLAYDMASGSWQTCRGDRMEMRPIRGAGLDGWNIDNMDSRGRLHCSNGRPGEHALIGRNLKQMIKLDQREYDEYKRTGNLPDRWEDLDLLTPRRARPARP